MSQVNEARRISPARQDGDPPMTPLSERIELVEKAMEGVTHPDAPAWISVAQDGNGPNGGFWTCAAATTESPRYIRVDIFADLAREAEALKREIAEMREALKPFADVADLVDSETEGVADSDEFQMHFHDYLMASWKLSIFRRARALLGGENAGN